MRDQRAARSLWSLLLSRGLPAAAFWYATVTFEGWPRIVFLVLALLSTALFAVSAYGLRQADD